MLFLPLKVKTSIGILNLTTRMAENRIVNTFMELVTGGIRTLVT